MKKKYIIVGLFFLLSCNEKKIYAPVGSEPVENPLDISIKRNKNRNQEEKKFIEEWITKNKTPFFPTNSSYWTSVDIRQRETKIALMTYQYEIYDFDWKKIYSTPVVKNKVLPVKEQELKAVDDALKYMNIGEELTLLVPSALAYGVLGDGKAIPRDLPLIIKLKLIERIKK